MKKDRFFHLTDMVLLAAAFIVCRFYLFDLHGMRQFPLILFLVGIAVLTVSLILDAKHISVLTLGGYILGFWAGFLFHSEGTDPGGGATSNFWIIWTVVFICGVLFGVATQFLLPWLLKKILDD